MADNTPKHPSGGVIKIENDYRNSPGRWNGPNTSVRPPALTATELQALRGAAPKTQPTFAERQAEAKRAGVELKPSVVIIGKSGTQKVQ
jgi:hypothetical protein